MTGRVRVDEVRDATSDVEDAVRRLLGQLPGGGSPLTKQDLQVVVASPATRLLVARDGARRVVGMATVVLFRVPSGMRAWVEDVVVDAPARGRGVGTALARAAVRLAWDAGARRADAAPREGAAALERLLRRADGG